MKKGRQGWKGAWRASGWKLNWRDWRGRLGISEKERVFHNISYFPHPCLMELPPSADSLSFARERFLGGWSVWPWRESDCIGSISYQFVYQTIQNKQVSVLTATSSTAWVTGKVLTHFVVTFLIGYPLPNTSISSFVKLLLLKSIKLRLVEAKFLLHNHKTCTKQAVVLYTSVPESYRPLKA